MASFVESAMYFERRAVKARTDGDQRRLLEVAEFYRKLSSIIPGFPRGYKMQPLSRRDRWAARAEECRTMAQHLNDPLAQEQMLTGAKSYEQLSASAESLQRAAE